MIATNLSVGASPVRPSGRLLHDEASGCVELREASSSLSGDPLALGMVRAQFGATSNAKDLLMKKPAGKKASGPDTPKTSGQNTNNGHADKPQAGAAAAGAGPASGPGAAPESAFTKPAPVGAAKKVSEVLGEIVWLMSQSALHKQFFISDLEWFVMTPVMLQQFRLFYDNDKPIGVAFWATVNEEVEARLSVGTSRLRPQDWKSGDRLWVVEVIAPFGGAEEMVKDLKVKVFADRELKFLTVGVGGKEVRVV